VRSLGIDIGSSNIKVVEVSGTSRNVQVLSYREFPLGTNPAFDRDLEIHDILKGLGLEYGNGQTRIVYALRQEFVSTRFKTFPFADRLKILKSLPFELEEDLPYSSDTAIYDARMSQVVGNSAEVVAVAAPKQRIESALRQLNDSGLPPTILTAEALAYSNCFERWQEAPRSTGSPAPHLHDGGPMRVLTARLHIGHTHTLVLAFEGDRLLGARAVLWGAKQVIDSIARRYEIPFIEAEKEMKTKAFILLNKSGASYDQILFSDTIANQVRDLGKEVKISMLEFENELGGEFVAAEVSGGFSQALNIHPYLTQQLEVPVNRTQFLANFNTSFEKTPAVEAGIGVALGLAIEGLRKPKNPAIQLLRADFAKQNDGFKEFWNSWGSAVQFSAALLVIFFIYAWLRESYTLELADQAQEALKTQGTQVAGLNARNANEAGVRLYIRNQKTRAAQARSLETVLGMTPAIEIMKKISDAIPGRPNVQLKIQKLHIEDERVTLMGVVKQAAQVRAIENSLRAVARGNVTAQMGAALPNQTGVNFTITFQVDRNLIVAK
jgi:general secretion pathway protein L